MDLEAQLQALIDEAPQDGNMPEAVANAVVPVLRAIAEQLQHREYYVLQTTDWRWMLTALRDPEQPEREKQAIYAFATHQDAARFQGSADPQAMAAPVPVTHVLFQLFAMEAADSVVVLDAPGNLSDGIEVPRRQLQALIEQQLEQARGSQEPAPSDWA